VEGTRFAEHVQSVHPPRPAGGAGFGCGSAWDGLPRPPKVGNGGLHVYVRQWRPTPDLTLRRASSSSFGTECTTRRNNSAVGGRRRLAATAYRCENFVVCNVEPSFRLQCSPSARFGFDRGSRVSGLERAHRVVLGRL